MASFDTVNYSLRPSKHIQRQLIFEGIRVLHADLALENAAYVGFGSIWFTDFVMAHKLLNISDMVSIEGHKIGYRRAVFNAPYATVRVEHGHSSAVLPKLYTDDTLEGKPWVVWLDFDIQITEAIVNDIRSVIEHAPVNTVFLTTFNGRDSKYGRKKDRPGRLEELFGGVVPDKFPEGRCTDDAMQWTLADLATDFMKAVTAPVRRGGFIPAFRAVYQDTTPMVTVGGVLPSNANAAAVVQAVVGGADWRCRPMDRIVAPHLTMREAFALQSVLPRPGGLSRRVVRSLKLDLEDEQIDIFEKYYKEYPAFAQIVA